MIRLDSTDTELDALHAVCERLGGFDARVTLEWLDGALAALLAGPRVPAGPEAVLEPLLGDAWARTFSDPDDAAQALAALAARWRVLRSQLDPEALYEDDQTLRLAPALLSPIEGEPTEGFALGQEWAEGFLAVAQDPAWGWDAVPHDEFVQEALGLLQSLAAPADEPADGRPADPAADAAGGDAPVRESREDRVDAAAFAVQDLRLWWMEHAPRTAPRQAERTPGRNDPCPCGSGKKYKKCHGAA